MVPRTMVLESWSQAIWPPLSMPEDLSQVTFLALVVYLLPSLTLLVAPGNPLEALCTFPISLWLGAQATSPAVLYLVLNSRLAHS